MLTGFDFMGASDQKVNLVNASGLEKRVDADTFVVSVGFEPDTGLCQILRGSTPELYLIWDARAPMDIMGAIWDAYEICRNL